MFYDGQSLLGSLFCPVLSVSTWNGKAECPANAGPASWESRLHPELLLLILSLFLPLLVTVPRAANLSVSLVRSYFPWSLKRSPLFLLSSAMLLSIYTLSFIIFTDNLVALLFGCNHHFHLGLGLTLMTSENL